MALDSIIEIDDHEAAALARLPGRLRGKPKFAALVGIWAAQIQELETCFRQIINARFVSTATGASLDVLGSIVGEPRNAGDDDDYRVRINARIAINKSSGTADELLNIFRILLPNALLSFAEYSPASFALRATDATEAAALGAILGQARAAGVRGFLEYNSGPASEAFSFAGGPGLGFGDGAFSSVTE